MLTPAVLFALFLVFLGLTWTLSLAESAFSYLSRRDAEDIVREQPGSKALEIARERESHLGALRVWRFVAEALSAVCLTAAADAVVDDTWLAVAIAAVVLVGVAALLGVWSPRPIGSRNEAAVARRLGGLVWVLRRALGPLAARLDRDRRRREVEPEDEDDFQERHLREFVARAHDADVLADAFGADVGAVGGTEVVEVPAVGFGVDAGVATRGEVVAQHERALGVASEQGAGFRQRQRGAAHRAFDDGEMRRALAHGAGCLGLRFT